MEQLPSKNAGTPPAGNAPAAILLAFTLLAVPLSLAPGWHAFDITPKLFALVVGAALTWIALAVRGEIAVPPHAVSLALGALAAAGILATLLSTDRVLSLQGADWRRMGLPAWLGCVALAAAIAAMPGDRRALLRAIAAAGVVAAIYALFQYRGHDPWIDPALYHIGEGEWQIVRPPSTFGYVSYFALYLAAAIFLAAGLAVDAAARWLRWTWAAGAAVMTIALIVTGSRGAWLGAMAGIVMLAMKLPQRRTLLIALLIAAALGGAFIASPLGQPVRSRMRWFVEDPEGGSRWYLWRDSLRLAAAHPLLGVGPDAFGLAFATGESLDLARAKRDFYIESPHNVFLDYLTSAGPLALAAFLALAAIALRGPDIFLTASFVAALVAAQFIADIIPTRLLMLALAALAAPRATPARRLPSLARWAIAACAAASLAALAVFGIPFARSDRALHDAETAARSGRFDLMLAAGPRAQQAYPFEYSRLLGQIAMLPGLAPGPRAFVFVQAEAAARAALPHSERPQLVHVHLASLAALQGRFPEARTELEAAIRAAPSWFRPRWQLSLLLEQSGRHAEAAQQAAAALERGAREVPEIATQLRKIERREP